MIRPWIVPGPILLVQNCQNNRARQCLESSANCCAGGIGCEGVDRGQSRRCLDAVEIYNPDGDFWRDGPPLPRPLLSVRSNATNAGVVDGKLYICGYYRGAGKCR